MEIAYRSITLRDPVEADVENELRWMTVETAWQQWETPDSIAAFPGEEVYRARALAWVRQPKTGHRWSFNIETDRGEHIGMVNSYLLGDDLAWMDDGGMERPGPGDRVAMGIFIYESARWSQGYGTDALTAFLSYLLSEGCGDIYLGTYSANVRMLGLAQKLGFRECRRRKSVRTVGGEPWDDVTLRLDQSVFQTVTADFA